MTTSPATSTDSAARDLLGRFPVLDGHNDLAWALREAGSLDPAQTDLAAPVAFTLTDLPRLAAGGVGAQFWSVYVPAELQGDAAVATTLEQIDLVHQMIMQYPAVLELALTAADVERHDAAPVESIATGHESVASRWSSQDAASATVPVAAARKVARFVSIAPGLSRGWSR